MGTTQLAATRLPLQHRSHRSFTRIPTACSARRQESNQGPSRHAVQLVSIVGAAALAFLPLSAPVQARPSDMVQSRPGDDKLTKFPSNPSVSGNQARGPSKNATGGSTDKPAGADVRAATALDPDAKSGSVSNVQD